MMKYPNLSGPENRSVESSSIRTIGYDENRKELYVDFHKSGTYIYSDITPEKHRALMEADSHGNHLHQFIKGAHAHRKS